MPAFLHRSQGGGKAARRHDDVVFVYCIAVGKQLAGGIGEIGFQAELAGVGRGRGDGERGDRIDEAVGIVLRPRPAQARAPVETLIAADVVEVGAKINGVRILVSGESASDAELDLVELRVRIGVPQVGVDKKIIGQDAGAIEGDGRAAGILFGTEGGGAGAEI